MSLAVNSLLSTYSYTYQSAIRPKLDKNDDSYWSQSELKNYTRAYEKATGTKLDAEKILSTYDADKDKRLSISEQTAVNKDDALGLKALSKKPPEANISITGQSISEKLAELMKTMSASSKVSLSNVVRRSQQASELLSNFGMAGDFSMNNIAGLMAQQNAAKMYAYQMRSGKNNDWNALSGQVLNMVV